MTKVVDLYWSMRNPLCWMIADKLMALSTEYDFDINPKVMYPLTERGPDYYSDANLVNIRYLVTEINRYAEQHDFDHHWPDPDPIVQDLASWVIAEEQPYIARIVRLAIQAKRQGKGMEFLREFAQMIFGGTKQWDKGDHIKHCAQRCGLDYQEMVTAIEGDEVSHDAQAEQHATELIAAGHYNIPTMIYQGEIFFGPDRVDTLMWRMKQHGLKRRQN